MAYTDTVLHVTADLQSGADERGSGGARIGARGGTMTRSEVHDRLTSMADLLGRKWNMVIVYELLEHGPCGFTELNNEIKEISNKVLVDSLDDLGDRGLVDRTIVNERPFRVEYSATDRGRKLHPIIDAAREDFEWLSNRNG